MCARGWAGALALVGCVALGSCGVAGFGGDGRGSATQKRSQGRVTAAENSGAGYGEPETLSRLDEKTLDESSGLVASALSPGTVWTHNDSGSRPLVYAFDLRGRPLGIWEIANARLRDWEDMARGPGPEPGRSYLYIGDIGDNRRARPEVVVYRFAEPTATAAASEGGRALTTESAEAIRLKYPDGPHDAEALLVHPRTGDLYLVTKVAGAAAGIYKLAAPLRTDEVNVLKRVGEFMPPTLVGGLVTGGDISPDGRRVVLCDYANGYEFRLPARDSDFDAIWREPPTKFSLGEREQGEAVAYAADGAAVLATSEGKRPPLFRVTIPK